MKRLTSNTINKTVKQLVPKYRKTAETVINDTTLYYAGKYGTEELSMLGLMGDNKWYQLTGKLTKEVNGLGRAQSKALKSGLTTLDKGIVKDVSKQLQKYTFLEALPGVNKLPEQSIINTVWCKDGRSIADRIIRNDAWLAERVKSDILNAAHANLSPEELEKILKKDFQMAFNQTERLIRTEAAHTETAAAVKAYKEHGITHGRWVAHPDCCDHCQDNNGLIRPLDELESEVPAHPNCLCSIEPVILTDSWQTEE